MGFVFVGCGFSNGFNYSGSQYEHILFRARYYLSGEQHIDSKTEVSVLTVCNCFYSVTKTKQKIMNVEVET